MTDTSDLPSSDEIDPPHRRCRSSRLPELHGVGGHRHALDDERRRAEVRTARRVAGRRRAISSSSRSATATSASTRRRTRTSPRRCRPRSRRSTRCRRRPRSCFTPATSRQLAKAAEFDTADQVLRELAHEGCVLRSRRARCRRPTTARSYLERYGKRAQRGSGGGWYSFDHSGVHFIGLVNVFDLKAGGLGSLGAEQLAWLEKDVKHLSAARRSWCSRTFRSGPCIPSGAGEPTTARARWRI